MYKEATKGKKERKRKDEWIMTISEDGERRKRDEKSTQKKKQHTRDETSLTGKARPAQ